IVQSQQTVYGINTGFGPLCTTLIDVHDTRKLQENILKSHAVGVGAAIERLLSKLMLILKIHALAKGYSGVQWSTVERMLWHVDNDISPVVPHRRSVGASGDRAAQSHLDLDVSSMAQA
ncbi:aromatic amino acid ammonia-lyase, partial [Burkholderia cenocepacia]